MGLASNSHEISQTTIFKQSIGNPEPYLRLIADAGFTHLHWSHQWYTDFLYSPVEVAQIRRWLKEYNLQVLDIHATAGQEKRWDAPEEYRRLAGVALVRNRLELAAQLEAHTIVLHAGPEQPLETQLRSLSALEPVARQLGVRIAVENFWDAAAYTRLEHLFAAFTPEALAFCYDTGHGNMYGPGLDFLELWKDRLAVVHVHDNDGTSDQHQLPFTGSVDWNRFCKLLDASAYTGPINLECTLDNHTEISEAEFLQAAHRAGERLEAMRGQ